jgi:hypothetical protein
LSTLSRSLDIALPVLIVARAEVTRPPVLKASDLNPSSFNSLIKPLLSGSVSERRSSIGSMNAALTG